MPPEEMTGSTHILEFMCYAIAGSAGIRFCMEMVMSSSSDASAQRRRRRVGRRRGVLRGLAGAALRAGARAASRARRGRGPGPGARRRAVGPDAVRAERGAQARQSQRASKGPRVPQHPILVLLDVLHQTHGLPQVLRVAPRVRARREAEAVRRLSYVHRGFVEVVRPDDVEALGGGLRGHTDASTSKNEAWWTPGRTKLSSECATAAAAALVAQSARATRRRMVAMCREGWNYLLIPSRSACAGIELFPPAVSRSRWFDRRQICGVVGGPPADD